jgi:hypothetical protein
MSFLVVSDLDPDPVLKRPDPQHWLHLSKLSCKLYRTL